VYEVGRQGKFGLKIVVLLINVAAVVYLLLSKYLFGIRGGAKGLRSLTVHEASLLEDRGGERGNQ